MIYRIFPGWLGKNIHKNYKKLHYKLRQLKIITPTFFIWSNLLSSSAVIWFLQQMQSTAGAWIITESKSPDCKVTCCLFLCLTYMVLYDSSNTLLFMPVIYNISEVLSDSHVYIVYRWHLPEYQLDILWVEYRASRLVFPLDLFFYLIIEKKGK